MLTLQDKLEQIFDEQSRLANTIINKRYPINTEERISVLSTAIIHEAIELQRLTNWKWWKKPTDFDYDKAREELVDIWHFSTQAAIELGMSPKELYLEYMNKNKINHERQKSGY